MKSGAEGRVIIGVVNHEYRESTYRLVVRLNEEVIGEERVELGHNERWEEPFTFTATKRGKDQRLELLLYKDGEEGRLSITSSLDRRNIRVLKVVL
ncbi:hypothetical protein FHEFKHOI_02015 [Candidatus Methanoperedenaceae archaeon GB50]|nr:hypothetical protein FHEFKHOI_02015 [Candidatus Methanoperedenaceae archaeon GB50]